MCQSFDSMGYASAEREIELAENTSNPKVRSEIKPFTTKTDAHVIEALDVVASSMGISRNTLVVKLINHYLPQAFIEFQEARFSVFSTTCSEMPEKTSEQFVLNALTHITESTDMSDEARNYLNSSIVRHVVGGLDD